MKTKTNLKKEELEEMIEHTLFQLKNTALESAEYNRIRLSLAMQVDLYFDKTGECYIAREYRK